MYEVYLDGEHSRNTVSQYWQSNATRSLVQVKAVFPKQGLEMVAQVYSNPKLGCLVVELIRRAGDAFEFNNLREDLAQELEGVISGAADVKAVASRWVMQGLKYPCSRACTNRRPNVCLGTRLGDIGYVFYLSSVT